MVSCALLLKLLPSLACVTGQIDHDLLRMAVYLNISMQYDMDLRRKKAIMHFERAAKLVEEAEKHYHQTLAQAKIAPVVEQDNSKLLSNDHRPATILLATPFITTLPECIAGNYWT